MCSLDRTGHTRGRSRHVDGRRTAARRRPDGVGNLVPSAGAHDFLGRGPGVPPGACCRGRSRLLRGARMTQEIDWLAIAAPTTLALAAVLVLLVSSFAGTPRSRTAALVPAKITVVAVAVAAVPTVASWRHPASTFCIDGPRGVEGGPAPCSFVVDRFTLVFWAVVLFGTAVVALIGTVAVQDGRTPLGEWNFLLLCSATGALRS